MNWKLRNRVKSLGLNPDEILDRILSESGYHYTAEDVLFYCLEILAERIKKLEEKP